MEESFDDIWEKKNKEIIKDYFQTLRDYEANRNKENFSATCLQSYYKAFEVRRHMELLRKSAILIQKTFRGYLGRRRALIRKSEIQYETTLKLYHSYSTKIQKIWRGFKSRRDGLDFYQRKQYIENIKKEGELMVEKMNKERQRQEEEAKKRYEENKKKKFEYLTERSHHLISTKSILGVYNDPHPDLQRTAFGETMDSHLKKASKRALRRRFIRE